MKKRLWLCLALAFAALVGCAKKGPGRLPGIAGIAMPTRSEERWLSAGESIKKGLEALGYQGDLQYGDGIIENQINQIENMITGGVKALVIAPIDGESLTGVLEKAHGAGIPVIAYDRLIRGSPYVDYYVSFDNYKIGRQMGGILIQGLKLDEAVPEHPKIIEVFGGSPDDDNAYFFYNGAMDEMKPYFDQGVLKIGSGQRDMYVAGTLRWDGAAAQARMANLLSAYYTDQTLDGALSPYDPISLGILQACKDAGYGTPEKPLPIVGGQDAAAASIKSILAGEQYATVFRDTRSLAAATVEMLKAVMAGETPQVNNINDYANGSVKNGAPYIVPSMLLQSTVIFRDNAKQILVDETGYYTAAELGIAGADRKSKKGIRRFLPF